MPACRGTVVGGRGRAQRHRAVCPVPGETQAVHLLRAGYLLRARCSTLYNIMAHTAMSSSQLFTHRAEDQRQEFALADRNSGLFFLSVSGGIKEQGLSISAKRKSLQSIFNFYFGFFSTWWRKIFSAPLTLPIVHVFDLLADSFGMCV